MSPDIVIYAIVALGLVLWLKSILGTRHGNERSRPNPFVTPRSTDTSGRPPASRAPAPEQTAHEGMFGTPALQSGLDRNMSVTGVNTEQGLTDISRADRAFDLIHFLRGAQDAFVMVVEAYAAGDRSLLRDLLSDPVYQAFSNVIAEREKNLQKASVEIHAVRRVEVVSARLENRDAYITVRFVTDETNVLRDAAGRVIEGNPDRVSEIIDIWTFTRNLRSRNPAWIVSETREENEGPITGKLPD
ncbi:MAG TPA: Tim44/TimA family putative adaptor protein [Patescibacteria group bacterium]|nr:Tim44/TimA family putative adaptor protein [Patescibacteria group bacterium]